MQVQAMNKVAAIIKFVSNYLVRVCMRSYLCLRGGARNLHGSFDISTIMNIITIIVTINYIFRVQIITRPKS